MKTFKFITMNTADEMGVVLNLYQNRLAPSKRDTLFFRFVEV